MYIYNGKFTNESPRVKAFDKKIFVSSDDILLTFIQREIRGKNIYYRYSIEYFNMPVEPTSYLFSRLVDIDSVKKAVLKSVNEQKCISIYKIDIKEVTFVFSIENWLRFATKPINISSKKGVGTYFLKSNVRLPEMVNFSFDFDCNKIICSVLKETIKNESRFKTAFKRSFPNSLIFKDVGKFEFMTINYDNFRNVFEISIRNDVIQLMFFR